MELAHQQQVEAERRHFETQKRALEAEMARVAQAMSSTERQVSQRVLELLALQRKA